MVEIIPHINTLIVDIGSEFAKVGYSGDFHPKYRFRTADFITPKPASPLEIPCRILEKYVKECLVDSLIIVESPDSGPDEAAKMLRFLFTNKLCQSVFFLKSQIADAFGFGKVSGTVVSCSASAFRTTVVQNGRISETHALPGGARQLESIVSQLMTPESVRSVLDEMPRHSEVSGTADETAMLYSILESQETIDRLKSEYDIDILAALTPTIMEVIESVSAMRCAYYINKKNSANGCIILSGGLFRFDPFYTFFKLQMMERIGADFSDFILRDKELNCTFVGASVFGMNPQTKPMFITSQDWQSMGAEILDLKSIK